MKKIFILTIALMAFSFVNAQDKINSIKAPMELKADEKITVSVDYTASEARSIILNLQLGEAPWTPYGFSTVDVPAGTGTKAIVLKVKPSIPVGSNYKISAVLTTANGTWNERIDVVTQPNVSAVK